LGTRKASLRYHTLGGTGSPDGEEFSSAIQALYSTSYPLKFIGKSTTGLDYVIPPLEALWWAEDYSVFTHNERNYWKWTLLSHIPEWITQEILETAQVKALAKGNPLASQITIRTITEGLSYQAIYKGPFSGKALCCLIFMMS
jgi:hypothetical protein